MPTIDVDDSTYQSLDLAARLTSMSHGQVIARLITQSTLVEQAAEVSASDDDNYLAVHGDYLGHRTTAMFDCLTHRIDITNGPLTGQSFKTPSSAARALVSHYNPTVSPHRNGWTFWVLSDGGLLQRVRRR